MKTEENTRQDTLRINDPQGQEIVLTADEIYTAVFEDADYLNKFGFSVKLNDIYPELKFSQFPVEPIIVVKENKSGEEFEIILQILVKIGTLEFEVNDFFGRKADHIIHAGIWYPFIKGSQDFLGNLARKAGVSDCGKINLKQYLILLAMEEIKPYFRDMTSGDLKAGEIANQIGEKEQPVSLKAILYPYQKTGYRWLSWMTENEIGCILGDEMGLGKTLQVIAVLCERSGKGKPSLIIAPVTLLENWCREINRFAPELKVLKHHGSNRMAIPSELRKWNVVLTSYETVGRDIYMLKLVEWDLVVLDEAQAIKNPEAIRTLKSKLLTRTGSIAVTGTPMQNRLLDLWSITDFALPGYLGEQHQFNNHFVDDLESARRLEPLVTPILLRRTINEVAHDLPDKIEIPQPIEMDDKSAQEYEEYRQELFRQYQGQTNLGILTKLREYCTHPFLVGTGTGDLTCDSQKYVRLTEILDEIFLNGDKALIFTSYVKMIELMKADIACRYGVYSNHIDGSVAIQSRQGIIDEFSKHNGVGALILNPNAAGVGLNITTANHVIHFNLEWNPATEDQATGRAYRIGQDKPVTVHRMFYINTVEEAINERLDRKRELAEQAIAGVEGSETELSDILNAIQKSPLRGGK